MKYLITGGAGFIGSHLTERLLKDKSTVIDDLSVGKRDNLPKDSRVRLHEVSILDDIGRLFKGVDVVFHLAALTRPQWSILHPEETDTVNVHGTLKVLEHCRDNKVKRVVFISSSSIYGQTDIVPTPEDTKPNPMSPYALSKLIGEQYCELFGKLYGLEINRIRPFNVYGTRQDPVGEYAAAVPRFVDRVNSFINVLKADSYPVITGDGKQERDFVYVEDVVELLVLAAKSKVYGEAFNAGSGKNVSINDLYEMVCKVMKSNTKAVHIAPVFEPRQTLADISKAKRMLGWEPKISLEEGLRRTIEGTI
jgi:nucleoside-diphosphate-sugar epimerase